MSKFCAKITKKIAHNRYIFAAFTDFNSKTDTTWRKFN